MAIVKQLMRRTRGGKSNCWRRVDAWKKWEREESKIEVRKKACKRAKARPLRIRKAAVTANMGFHPFPQLPTELQLRIWQLAATEPRAVVLSRDSACVGLVPISPVPAILHACHLSREVGLKTYTLSFGNKYSAKRTYFDFSKDTLYIPRCKSDNFFYDMVELFDESEYSQIRSLAIALDGEMDAQCFSDCMLVHGACRDESRNYETYLVVEKPRLDLKKEIRLCKPGKRDLWTLAQDVRTLRTEIIGKDVRGEKLLDACAEFVKCHFSEKEGDTFGVLKAENW